MSTSGKIFGVGLPKTATMSFHFALMHLGYRSVHWRHKSGPLRGQICRPEDLELCDAGSDLAVAAVFEELDTAYPGSKFVYTERDLPGWLESIRIQEYVRGDKTRGWGDAGQWASYLRRRAFGPDPPRQFRVDWFAAAYHRHERRVFEYFAGRPGDLLRLNICAGDGWPTLCPFLGRPIPERPFPYRNRTPDRLRRSQ